MPYYLVSSVHNEVNVFKFNNHQGLLSKEYMVQPNVGLIRGLIWNHNNKVFCTCAEDGIISLNKAMGGETIMTLPEDKGLIREDLHCIAMTSGSRYLASGGVNKLVKLWDLKSKQIMKQFNGHSGTILDIQFNDSDRHIASSSDKGDILIHDIGQNVEVERFHGDLRQSVRCLMFSPFKKHLLAAGDDCGTVNIWDVDLGQVHSSFKMQHSGPCTGIEFSRQNHMLMASVGMDKKLYLYDIAQRNEVTNVVDVGEKLECFSFLEDGAIIAVGTSNGMIHVFDIRRTAEPIQTEYLGHKLPVKSVVFQKTRKKISDVSPFNSVLITPSKLFNSKNDQTDTAETIHRLSPIRYPPKPSTSMDTFANMSMTNAKDRYSRDEIQQSIEKELTQMKSADPIKPPPNYETKDNTFTSMSNVKDRYTRDEIQQSIEKDLTEMKSVDPIKPTPNYETKENENSTETDYSGIDIVPSSKFGEEKGIDTELTLNELSNQKRYDQERYNSEDLEVKLEDHVRKSLSARLNSSESEFGTKNHFIPSTEVSTPVKTASKKDSIKEQLERLRKQSLIPSKTLSPTISTSPQSKPNIPKKHMDKNQMDNFNLPSPEETKDELPSPIPSKHVTAFHTNSLDPSMIQAMIKQAMQESMRDLRQSFHRQIQDLHVEVLRQFHQQQEEISSLKTTLSNTVEPLLEELNTLRKQNENLRAHNF